jgi:hypothetical protein
MLDRERASASRGPDEEEEVWIKKLCELEAKEECLLDLYLEGKLEADRYGARVSHSSRPGRLLRKNSVALGTEPPT